MYAEHTIEPGNCRGLGYKGKREHFLTASVPNQGYSGQLIKVSFSSKKSVDLQSSNDKERSVVNNICRVLVTKKHSRINRAQDH